ncbi:GNAT family N-acetyltransferase [Sabulibacter ruber]|uniref:GNAT family N-acetyltransferase n=1 Tax=Sabulibacter ruber TaxID=2811901 RepID=UPI001A97A633|nr:GNAT family N-acetyltransferase [Sabulibacter ruber]
MPAVYHSKKAEDLREEEIATILEHWEVPEWRQMDAEAFREKFAKSDFHLLVGERSEILCVARINFDFRIRINDQEHDFAEFVGFVAMEKGKGYGTQLLEAVVGSMKARNVETIGFCEQELRPFYEKCGIEILYDKAKRLREMESDQWVVPTDDDILVLNLSSEKLEALRNLNEDNLGYLICPDI